MTETRSIELEVGPQVTVFGEFTEIPQANGTVVLVHDLDADLDSLKPFIGPLHSLLVQTLLIDMPGHGLSSGDWDSDGSAAVLAAIAAATTRTPSVGVIAVGAATRTLFGLERPAVHAVALVQPHLMPADLEQAESWRSVPQISMGDPCDAEAQESMEHLSRWVRAWSTRLHVHYLDEPSPHSAAWTDHMTYSAAAFVAEQFAYRNHALPASSLGAGHV